MCQPLSHSRNGQPGESHKALCDATAMQGQAALPWTVHSGVVGNLKGNSLTCQALSSGTEVWGAQQHRSAACSTQHTTPHHMTKFTAHGDRMTLPGSGNADVYKNMHG